jgi:hypothetical protein
MTTTPSARAPQIRAALTARYPDGRLPARACIALAAEFGVTPTYVRILASQAGYSRPRQPSGGLTHCSRGHALTPETVRDYGRDGRHQRTCLTCKQEYNRQRTARVRGEPRTARGKRRRQLVDWAESAIPLLRDELLPLLCPEHAPWRPGEAAVVERLRALLADVEG